MESQINLGDIAVDVVRKRIKNVYLSVNPPAGRVRISAPQRMSMRAIRAFAVSKLDWIERQQKYVREQEAASPRQYVEGEFHDVWGERFVLAVTESDRRSSVGLACGHMFLEVKPRTDRDDREALVEAWYRERLVEAVPPLLRRWQPRLGVRVKRFSLQRMKTRWGSCSFRAHTIRLNTELARRPPECLEYIVVHELVHLLEPSHNKRFHALMDRFMPAWRAHDELLNRSTRWRQKRRA